MNFSRRDFVKLGGIAAVTSLGLSTFVLGQKRDDILVQQTSDSLRKLIGTDFYFTNDKVSTIAILTKINDFPNKTAEGQSYSMEFNVPLKRIKHDTYRVWHADLGNFELYCTDGQNGKNRTLLATITLI
jgi:hypothetical protein